VADPTLYLFDGSNLYHAGGYTGREELVDALASFLGLAGARGIAVFDGTGTDRVVGPLEVRFSPDADALLERLAAENRRRELVCLVSSDTAVRGTAGLEVVKLSSSAFLDGLDPAGRVEGMPSRVRDRLDPETRDRLERFRRGE
jgi:predicted RNA-binding protein with PIN domain